VGIGAGVSEILPCLVKRNVTDSSFDALDPAPFDWWRRCNRQPGNPDLGIITWLVAVTKGRCYTMMVTLPLPPNRANQSRGDAKWEWSKKKKYIEGTRRAVGAKVYARSQLIGVTLPLGPTEIQATLYVHQRMDDDNLTSRLKWPLDTLVAAGILVDDKRPHCILREPRQEIDRKNPRVELTLLEAE